MIFLGMVLIKKDNKNSEKISNKPIQAHIKEKNEEIPLCSKCKSPNIEIRYGKYSYYFKCLACDGNSSISLTCKDKSCKPKLKKRKLNFYQTCEICKKDELFFTNPLNIPNKEEAEQLTS